MRFLILTQYYAPEIGAPQTRLAAVVRELAKLHNDVEIVTALPNYPTGRIFDAYRNKVYTRETLDGVTIHRVWLYPARGGGLKRMLNYASFAITCLAGLLRAQRPDYLFVESPPLFLSLPARLMALYWRVPLIFNVADLWPDSIRDIGVMRDGFVLRAADRLEAWTYRKSDFINAVTEGIASILVHAKRVPPDKVLFFPNGVDTEMFQPSPPNPELIRKLGLAGKQVVLYAGTLGYVHGFDVALEAMERLAQTDPDLILLAVGSGSERPRLEKAAAARRLVNVRFLDPVCPAVVNRMYALSCAGLSTLRDLPLFEGTRPSKILPAMAAGKPVVYCGNGEGARLIAQAGAGIIVPPETPEALAAALRQVARDPAYAAELGRNGRLYVEKHLGWAALVASWLRQLNHRASARSPSSEIVYEAKTLPR